MKSSHGCLKRTVPQTVLVSNIGGNQGKTDKNEADQARSRGMAESLSGAREQDDRGPHLGEGIDYGQPQTG